MPDEMNGLHWRGTRLEDPWSCAARVEEDWGHVELVCGAPVARNAYCIVVCAATEPTLLRIFGEHFQRMNAENY